MDIPPDTLSLSTFFFLNFSLRLITKRSKKINLKLIYEQLSDAIDFVSLFLFFKFCVIFRAKEEELA